MIWVTKLRVWVPGSFFSEFGMEVMPGVGEGTSTSIIEYINFTVAPPRQSRIGALRPTEAWPIGHTGRTVLWGYH